MDPKPLECEFCSMRFDTEFMLIQHTYSCINNPNMPIGGTKYDETLDRFCTICKKLYKTKSGLNTHMNRIHRKKIRPSKCDYSWERQKTCKRKQKTEGELDTHISHVQVKPNPHKCETCKISYFTEYELKQHIDCLHLRLKPHKCDLCVKAYFRKYELNRHINHAHLKLRPHECQACGKAYFTKIELD